MVFYILKTAIILTSEAAIKKFSVSIAVLKLFIQGVFMWTFRTGSTFDLWVKGGGGGGGGSFFNNFNNFLPAPAGIYLLKVNNRNTRTRCEICSMLTLTPMASFWCLYC